MLLLFLISEGEWLPFWEELFIQFSVRVYLESLSVRVCASFPFVLRAECGIRLN